MMKNKDGTLGRPSYVWRKGQERRLNFIRKHIALENKKILDVGCGEGLYLRRFRNFTQEIFGVDIDKEKIAKIRDEFPNVKLAPAENLPFPNGFFDVVLFNEVLEHVEDDRKAIEEAFRCLKSRGKLVIFAPNRLYPFESHGIYWNGKYHFGNFPFVGYLPNFLRNKICPHVRTYTKGGILKLFSGFDYKILVFTQIYPGFDKIALKSQTLPLILRKTFYFLEKTPFGVFGLSHFLIIEKF